jgi:hypothetical protein
MRLSLVRVLLARLLALRLDRNRVLLLLVHLRVALLGRRLLRHLCLLLLLLLVRSRSLTAPGRRSRGLGRCALLLSSGSRSRCLRNRHGCLHRRVLLRVVLGVRLLLLVRSGGHGSRVLGVLAMLGMLTVLLDVTRVLGVLRVRRVVVRLLVLSMLLRVLLLLLLLSCRVGRLGIAGKVGAASHVSLLRVLVLRMHVVRMLGCGGARVLDVLGHRTDLPLLHDT